MHVIATAGHVDHGKSALVRALTGMEPDRLTEERRRGLTIDLGFGWTTLASGTRLAFVDVPGHERFVPTMLAGLGPVPAVMLVVAADEGWMPQSAEHLSALDAFGVRHGLLVVTRSDLADPAPARAEARSKLRGTSLERMPCVEVSSVTGQGVDSLRAALEDLARQLPVPDTTAAVRLWVDRSFTVRGSGTVVTGTLAAGRIAVGDELELASSGRRVRVRALQTLTEQATTVRSVARVAVNLRGVDRREIGRGDALLTPGRFLRSDVLDVRLDGEDPDDLPQSAMLHIGSAATAVRLRPIGAGAVRLQLARELPLWIGDRALLRDPGRRRVLGGVTVLDPQPPPLSRRGAAAARAIELKDVTAEPDLTGELRRRKLVQRSHLIAMGVPVPARPVAGDWLADPEHWEAVRGRLGEVVEKYARAHPLETGAPVELVRRRLGLPERSLVTALLRPPLVLRDGRVVRGEDGIVLPARVVAALEILRAELRTAPFAAPDADRLRDLGLGPREISAASRAGQLLRVTSGLVLLPGADQQALAVLADLPEPFTLSEARLALATTRRVAVPLLEMLERRGATERLADGRHRLRR
ncbi:MAG TPA: selenocysteine-specific translation elongation factor [Mycobacteriales bacterium]